MWVMFSLPVIASGAKQSSLKNKQFFDEVCQLNWRLLCRHFVAPRNTRFATLAHALSRAAASAGEQIAWRTLAPGASAGECRCDIYLRFILLW